jgi:hypothetical protein
MLAAEVHSIQARAAHLFLELAQKEYSVAVGRQYLKHVRYEKMDGCGARSIAQSLYTQDNHVEVPAT